MNLVLPAAGFLAELREQCSRHGALLIFDEVMTGFRVALGGAQAHYHIRPDLTTLGKVIGGGLPLGALGGRRDVMEKLAPLGPVYQAGTLSGNPLAVAAGLATLQLVSQPRLLDRIAASAKTLTQGLAEAAHKAGLSSVVKLDRAPADQVDRVCHCNHYAGRCRICYAPVHLFETSL